MSSAEQIREDQLNAGRRMNAGKGFKKKSPLVGHENFLKALECSGALVKFIKTSGEELTGVIKHSDKFTVSIDCGDNKPARVIFKHAIEEFQPMEHADKSAARE